VLDEFGELSRRIAEFKPNVDRRDEIKAEILSWCADVSPEKGTIFEGQKYSVHVGACKIKREIVNKFKCWSLLRKVLGLKAVVEKITIPLEKAVDAYIPVEQHKLFLVEKPGSRDVSAVAKATGVHARAA